MWTAVSLSSTVILSITVSIYVTDSTIFVTALIVFIITVIIIIYA
jgi:hypothetical protein